MASRLVGLGWHGDGLGATAVEGSCKVSTTVGCVVVLDCRDRTHYWHRGAAFWSYIHALLGSGP